MSPRRPSSRLVLAVLVPVVLVLGIVLGGHPRWLPGPVADVLVGDDSGRVVNQALDTVHDSYYRKIPRAKLADAAISGVVKSLGDRFSNYFTPQEFSAFQDVTNSRFSGVGLAVRGVPLGLRVETVYDGSPADRARIRVGDVITRSNGQRLAGRPDEAATALIKGPAGTDVTLTVLRSGRTLKKQVTRATVSIPVVASELERAGATRVTHITLATFSAGAHAELADAIRKAKRRGAKGIVFDLRGNGGGLVSEAQLVASEFLASGDVVTTRGRSVATSTLKALGQPIAGKLPTVVLVDGGTASASEIVTGALQDHERAKVVGTKTFGKGVFQEVLPLDNGGALDITVGQYFTPDGRNLGGSGTKTGVGIKPDVQAKDDPDTAKRDEALTRALAVLGREL